MIDGKKLVLIIFAIVIAIGVITYTIYILSRPDHDFPHDEDSLVRSATVEMLAFAPSPLVFR